MLTHPYQHGLGHAPPYQVSRWLSLSSPIHRNQLKRSNSGERFTVRVVLIWEMFLVQPRGHVTIKISMAIQEKHVLSLLYK
jgi:hypothetical protein